MDNIQSIIFGFGHRSRCGKDSAVAEIIRQRGSEYDIRRYGFGDALKKEVTASALAIGGMENHWNPNMEFVTENGLFMKLPEWVKYDPSAPMDDPLSPLGKQRTLLQWWGTEFRRDSNPNYWVDKVAKQIAEEKPEIALITDVRFPNEVLFVRQYGEPIRVDRPSVESPNSHHSEEALASLADSEWGYILKNDSDLETFKRRSLEAFDYLMNSIPK